MLLLEQESYICHIKKDYKKGIADYRPISILNLYCKIYTNSFESNAKKHLDTVIVEYQSEDTKNRVALLYAFFPLFVI